MIAASATLDAAEIDRFARVAPQWWDETGPFAPLHRLNPVRLGYIRQRIVSHYGLDGAGMKPLAGLRVLDAGCGGGLVAEPMTRMGADTVGIDADETAIGVARQHATGLGLAIDYRATTTDALIGETFDVVLALEIVEHVADPDAFVQSLKALLKPGGLLVMSTLNRTPKSYAAAIVGAEYVMRWLPRGTHDWKKFVKPSELARLAGRHGLAVQDVTGLVYDPLRRRFSLSGSDVAVNYFMTLAG